MGRILPRHFYDRETEIVAREMLGAIIECTTPEGTASAVIVETEAYVGEHDPACHAAAGRTQRTEPLYGPPGNAYVYFIYGVHWCFNAVTRREGEPSAVLVRAVEPLSGKSLMRERRGERPREVDLTNGPGKLCEALCIDGALNGVPRAAGDPRRRQGERSRYRDHTAHRNIASGGLASPLHHPRESLRVPLPAGAWNPRPQ